MSPSVPETLLIALLFGACLFTPLFLLFGSIHYSIEVSMNDKDYFYFTRKRKFRKKIKKMNMDSIEDFLQLSYSSLNWSYVNKNRMIAYPIQGDTKTKFVFEKNESHSNLFVKEGGFSIYEISTEYRAINKFDDSIHTKSFEARYNDILHHLEPIFQTLQEQEHTKEVQAKKEKQREAASIKKEKKDTFRSALQTNTLWKNKKFAEYHIQSYESEGYQHNTLSFNHIPLFSATSKNGHFTYEFFNQKSEIFSIIEQFQGEIISYFHSRMQTTENIVIPSKNIYSVKQNIEDTIQSLQQSSHWLSEENVHKLSHTYPHDLSLLFQTYNELEDKTAMQKTMSSTLQTIQSSLANMKQEIEENKQKDILHRSEVIQVRE